ncbi:hypothetical protein [Streptomyces alboflavus]|uniref:hypothetical protein n=1 Tax=Streptomyces alboflavus TaxID=67267 RepID=UPI0013312B04|nr:hypothetical protein [Streptomyces alboflavus]
MSRSTSRSRTRTGALAAGLAALAVLAVFDGQPAGATRFHDGATSTVRSSVPPTAVARSRVQRP